ncbi:cytoplasmic protein [Deltaproteobacteria bacterium Smac51]|nr:cytoplasmic protein [Deltaproteobacteria bacterium Smac51]
MKRLFDSLSIDEARRLVLHAQGFNQTRSGTPTLSRLKKNLDQLGVLQIDSVNALVRAHYLPLFSRLGLYHRDRLDFLTWGPLHKRAFFEYWGHEASFIPIALFPLLRWRMKRAAAGAGIYKHLARFGQEERPFIKKMLNEVRARGAVGAGELCARREKTGPWWGWTREKIAMEWLFAAGEVTVASRRGFERLYDLTERIVPSCFTDCEEVAEDEAQRRLVLVAAESLGLATEKDLRDYYRLDAADSKARVRELMEAGLLRPVKVEGWEQTAYCAASPRVPGRVKAGTLISPFDSLIWERSRTERLFNFRYRLEFYTPPEKRVYGYHVLPFLHGSSMVGRVDLKADRGGCCLIVPAVFSEGGGLESDEVMAALAENLTNLALWLDLQSIKIQLKGKLEKSLKRTVSLAGRIAVGKMG